MKERGILFSAPMVRAILADAKTQTRRVVKLGVHAVEKLGMHAGVVQFFDKPADKHVFVRCPYGVPGDRLWVRETWCPRSNGALVMERAQRPFYLATDGDGDMRRPVGWKWRPSIHMPRWASRITLEIAEVRVERLQSISTMDAMAEGVAPLAVAGGALSYTHGFRVLWDSINGERAGCSWDANPWVWALTFKRVEPGR